MTRLHAVLAVVAIVLVFAAAGLIAWVYTGYTRPGPLAAPARLVIPKGADVSSIARLLAERGVIDDPFIFKVNVLASSDAKALRAGEFEFPAAISQREVAKILVRGKTVLRRFTVVEGLTTSQVLTQLAKVSGLTGAVTSAPGEGELLPETYYFSYGESRDEIVARMRRAMTDVLEKLWAIRSGNLPYASKTEALTLASIIEKETSVAAERRRVASVFVNRLGRGIRLQSDPTVIYGITDGAGPLGRRLMVRDLETPSPFNTYILTGLPPGPIANPGRASIEAALNPLPTNDLYFVADGNGGHVFAETLEEHNRNVARWRRIRRRKLAN